MRVGKAGAHKTVDCRRYTAGGMPREDRAMVAAATSRMHDTLGLLEKNNGDRLGGPRPVSDAASGAVTLKRGILAKVSVQLVLGEYRAVVRGLPVNFNESKHEKFQLQRPASFNSILIHFRALEPATRPVLLACWMCTMTCPFGYLELELPLPVKGLSGFCCSQHPLQFFPLGHQLVAIYINGYSISAGG
jgi:hypothetical protein